VITFFEPDLSAKTFMFFVIVLFLHVFLSVLILFWILVHVIRISNVTIWAPRWMLIASSVVVSILAIARPATTGRQADLSEFVGTVELDHWYLGFLPTVGNLGNGIVWGASIVLLLLVLAVPWLVRGRRDQKAIVIADLCNGNARCSDACPYGAIEMETRDDASGHQKIAVVDPRLCTSCGLCVGVCPTSAIQVPDLPTAEARDRFKETVAATAEEPGGVVAVFSCARHAALGGVPVSVDGPIDVVSWDSEGSSMNLAISTVACSGMVNSRWIRDARDAGADSVVAVTCGRDDCRFEQGPTRLAERMNRGWIARDPSVHMLEVAPADPKAFPRLMDSIRTSPNGDGRGKAPRSRSLRFAFGMAVLAVILVVPSVGIRSTEKAYPADAGLRVAFVHGGEFLPFDPGSEIGGDFNPAVEPGQVLGRARHPVVLELSVDGESRGEEDFPPTGLRDEGKSSTLETIWLGSGEYDIEIRMMDDGATWRMVFDAPVRLDPETFVTLLWSEDLGQFEETSS